MRPFFSFPIAIGSVGMMMNFHFSLVLVMNRKLIYFLFLRRTTPYEKEIDNVPPDLVGTGAGWSIILDYQVGVE